MEKIAYLKIVITDVYTMYTEYTSHPTSHHLVLLLRRQIGTVAQKSYRMKL